MKNNKLLSETIALLKRERSENYSIEDSMDIAVLDQVIKNLEEIRDGKNCLNDDIAILLVLGKFLNKLPEIKEFLKNLVEL